MGYKRPKLDVNFWSQAHPAFIWFALLLGVPDVSTKNIYFVKLGRFIMEKAVEKSQFSKHKIYADIIGMEQI